MKFEFFAHHPSAYREFVLMLLLIIAINLLAIFFIFPEIKNINDAVAKSVILIIPWIVLLFSPSVIMGLIIYNSFTKKYLFEIDESGISIRELKRKESAASPKFLWADVKGFRFADFEDNHYFKLHFKNAKHDLILHRDSGEFEIFFEELKRYCEGIEPPVF